MIQNSFAQQFHPPVGPDMRPPMPGQVGALPGAPGLPQQPSGLPPQSQGQMLPLQPIGMSQGSMMPPAQLNSMTPMPYQPQMGPDMRPPMPGQPMQAGTLGTPQGSQLPANMQTDPNGYAQMMQRYGMQNMPSQL